MRMVDAHIHLDFYDNIEIVLNRIIACDIQAVFVTHLPELFERYHNQISMHPNITLALGYHPILIKEYNLNEPLFQRLKGKTKFIGEVGLDYSITSSQSLRAKQRDAFTFICKSIDDQILSIHSRLADEDTLEILINNGVKKAIFHWYSGSEKLVSKIVEQGYFFSVNQAMLRSNKGVGILKLIPLNRLLIETDGPFTKYRGHVVSPIDLKDIYKDFTEFYQADNIAKLIWRNYSNLVNDQGQI